MIRRFVADGLHWVAIAFAIVGAAAGMFFLPPTANPDLSTKVTVSGEPR
jgi:hypothetical protein